ncbi:protein-tyrosine phosphatase [Kitasatospora sp. MAP12-15]|uniref:tyrosine-protein phosphatase n=1 Tax=unclassified Kitasatospora TaxID=2633591 RepID=UPI002475BC10|nr:tyrosine-protein phosphatase [Kitasatospora sp. MAP12-44]MDH6112178.1 protein-tyrosine phosphatase [Kitasatospora sp. MAP12-44]
MDESLTDSRLLPIPGLRNARDVGGVGPLRAGLLYRSARLAELKPEGARQLAELGVRTVVDLRDPRELDGFPNRTYDWEVDQANFPLLPQDGTDHGVRPLDEVYPLIIDTAGPLLVGVLRRLLEPGALPALVHCAVGRDRTGIVIALLLDLLEVPQEQIVADYLLSNEGLGLLDGPREYVDVNGAVRLSYPVTAELITDLLARLRERHGGVAGYLADHGLKPSELAELRSMLRD